MIVNHFEQVVAKQAGFKYVMSILPFYDQVVGLLNRDYWKSKQDFTRFHGTYEGEIIKFYKLLLKYQLTTYYAYCHPFVSAIGDIAKWTPWDGMLSDIKRAEGLLHGYMEQNFQQHLLDKLHILSDNALEHQRRDVILKFKFPEDLPYEVYKAYLEDIDSPEAESGDGIRTHPKFVQWASSSNGVLVLSGIPGMGKSVLAKSMMVELPKHRSTIVCSFFFKDNGKGQNLATTALCRILDELFNARIELVDEIVTQVQNRVSQEIRHDVDLLWSVLEEATRHSEPGSVTIVLDAIDECDPPSTQQLLAKMSDYLRGPDPRLKFFLTTRPLVASEGLAKFAIVNIIESNEDDHCLKHLRNDIQRVVSHRFERFAKAYIQDDHLKKQLLSLIPSKEDRTYLYVKLLFDFLDRKVTDGLPRVPTKWIAVFKILPHTVAATYSEFLGRVRKAHRSDVKAILQMIVAAARPLHVRELNIALNVRDFVDGSKDGLDLQSDFKSWVLDAARFFLDIYNDRIYFIHQTVKDYLLAEAKTDGVNKPEWLGNFTLESCHRTLAESCIAYLALPFVTKAKYYRGDTNLDDGNDSNDPKTNYHAWRKDDLEFADYAFTYWRSHLEQCKDLSQGPGASVPPGKPENKYLQRLQLLQSWNPRMNTYVKLDCPP